jgi:hypothetical protein
VAADEEEKQKQHAGGHARLYIYIAWFSVGIDLSTDFHNVKYP